MPKEMTFTEKIKRDLSELDGRITAVRTKLEHMIEEQNKYRKIVATLTGDTQGEVFQEENPEHLARAA